MIVSFYICRFICIFAEKPVVMEKTLFTFSALQEARDFIMSLSPAVRRKVFFNIDKVAGGVRDVELFKKLNENIWEFRTRYNGMSYRLFAFWDKDIETFVIATHGLVKKTQKTPQGEIERAESIRTEYFRQKNKK